MGGFDAAAGQAYGGMQQGMQQGFGGPPAPGGYGAPGAPMQPGAAGDINTTTPLIFGVLAFLSCWPIGLFIGTFSLLAALKVKKLKEQGQLEAARASAASAKKLAFITWGVGFLIWVVLSVLYFVVFATAAAGS
jgi:fatty acid desaturase